MARQRVVAKFEELNGINRAFIDTMQVVGKNDDGSDKEAPLQYHVPADPAAFKLYIASLPDAKFNEEKDAWEGELADAHQAYWSGYDTKKRQEQRESAAAESTIIMVDKKPVDLMKLPPNKLVMAINGTLAAATATGREPQNAFLVAQKKLIAMNVAKLNEATGMLEMVAAA
jgi:hypothetical protein